jgi:N-acetylglucosamine-6-phosphate deacetylase
MLTITNSQIVTPQGIIEEGTLTIADGRILSIEAGRSHNSPGIDVLDGKGLTALPGFLDLHIHGGGGSDTMDAFASDALKNILRTHANFGTTGLLLTTMTQSQELISHALAVATQAVKQGKEFCPEGAQALGIHLEGPYISPKRPGAQPAEYVRDYDEDEFGRWLEIVSGTMKRITIAPERPGGTELLAACRNAGIVVSLGHTDATSAEALDALAKGATSATHLYNAMPPLHHRTPGATAIFLTDNRAMVEIIADGHHVAPEMIDLALRSKGVEGVILITDAMAGAGSGDGQYDLGGNAVTVGDGKAVLADGTLAGSILTMVQALRNVRAWFPRLSWNDLALLTSGNAARHMGWENKGRIAPGADADIVLLDNNLNLQQVYIAGQRIR